MLGIDTNVLIRFLTLDDEVQTPIAQKVLADPRHHPIYLSMLVLAEAYNIMTKVKKHPPAAVLEGYQLLLRSPALKIERPDMVAKAIENAGQTKAGFSDALIALQNAEARCAATATFDYRATRLDGMSPVEDYL